MIFKTLVISSSSSLCCASSVIFLASIAASEAAKSVEDTAGSLFYDEFATLLVQVVLESLLSDANWFYLLFCLALLVSLVTYAFYYCNSYLDAIFATFESAPFAVPTVEAAYTLVYMDF